MTGRRAFLKNAGLGLLAGGNPAKAVIDGGVLRRARALVASGQLGRIWLCRIPDARLTRDMEFVLCSQPVPIFDVDASLEETVLLGSHATLSIGPAGLHLFSSERR